MIYISCASCRFTIRVSPGTSGEAEALLGSSCEWYPNRYPCPKCGGMGELLEHVESTALPVLDPIDLSPHEAVAALYGLGLPEERECSAAAIATLLAGRVVKCAHTRPIRNTHRCLIDSLELDDGTRLYLGASAHGATVYRVAKPTSYAEKAG